ncbi:hypothetical protein ATE84_3697 [Aquimarina sp. MAR_2010_214]|uniref:hypothetical protein n=1 Tax=Aquimarina sp. MAR_2010_214 TaxID=1250026 RepID=UPI000CB9BDD1|nr:hypothetical protein [Aquimarina sp. MAR_2010_214]PKV51608.1 hypothetical protein ATE84_3697 [Aquimarina sp. MAR_2010_214]
MKKLNLKKSTISNLQLQQINGGVYHGNAGVVDSCTPDCQKTFGICLTGSGKKKTFTGV